MIEPLHPQLPPASADFLTVLAAALNDPANPPALENFLVWRDQPPVPLDTSWPG